MTSLPILFADGDWVRVLIPLVAFGLWALQHLLAGAKGAAKPAKQQRPLQPPRAAPVAPPAEKQRLNSEVDEFLRRAAAARAGKDQRRAEPASPPAPPPKPVRQLAPARDAAREKSAAQAQPADVQLLDAAPGQGVTAYVEQTMGKREFGKRVLQPTEVDQAEKALQSHVQKVFAHQVGSLSQPSAAAPPSAEQSPLSAPAALDMAALLREPGAMRDAIIVSEILRRPLERW